jgi:hypothetical protein
MVAGDRPRFADETAVMLRRRLTAAAGVVSVTLAAAFLGSLQGGTLTLWWLRAVTLIVTISCFAVLRGGRSFSLAQLRGLELGIFGATLVQLSVMLTSGLRSSPRKAMRPPWPRFITSFSGLGVC